MNDRDLANAYQRGAQHGDAGPCPDPDVLRDVIEGRTSESTRLEVINHVMACESCRHEFDLLDALHQADPSAAPPGMLPRWVVPIAAAAVVLLVAVTLWGPWTGTDQPVFRGGDTAVQLVTVDEEFASGSVRLVWRPVLEVVQYEVRITAPDGSFIASRQLSDTIVTFEGDWTAEPGAYEWRVSARRSDGTAVSSPVGSFRIE